MTITTSVISVSVFSSSPVNDGSNFLIYASNIGLENHCTSNDLTVNEYAKLQTHTHTLCFASTVETTTSWLVHMSFSVFGIDLDRIIV